MSQLLWRGYDQAALDAQINLRARTPEHEDYFARWARDSAALRARLDGQIDLAYGTTPAERLDLFPAAGGAGPLVAFIHGGYWQALDKSDFTYLAPAFLEAGIGFASLNYALAPDARIPRMIEQVRRALAWLHANAQALGFDPARLVVAGHSAGGHLVAMALATDWAGSFGLDATPLAGGCAVSGIYQLEPLRLSYQQEVLQLDPESARAASPQHSVPQVAPPLILAVGTQEPEEFLDQQAEFARAWRGAGHELLEMQLPERHHFAAIDALGEPGDPLHAAVRQLALEGRLP